MKTAIALSLLYLSLLAAVPALAGDLSGLDEALVSSARRLEESSVVVRVRGDRPGTPLAAATSSASRPWYHLLEPARPVLHVGTAPTDSASPLHLTTRYDRRLVARSVLADGHDAREGRGFFVGEGAILTSAALVDGARRVEVIGPKGTAEAVVAGIDRDFGIAVLRSSLRGPALEVDPSAELEAGRLLVLAAGEEGVGAELAVVASRATEPGRRGLARLSRALPGSATGAAALGPDGRVRGLVTSDRGLPATFGSCASCHGASTTLLAAFTLDRSTPFGVWDHGTALAHAGPQVAHLVAGRRIARALPGLLAEGRVRKAYLGLVLGVAEEEGKPLDERRIARLLPDSPAEGRLRAGDRIVGVGGRRLAPHDDVSHEILALEAGSEAVIHVERAGEKDVVSVEVVPTERTDDAGARGPAVFGFEATTLTPELKLWLRVLEDGVVVSATTPGGAADRAGLRRGDRVVRLAGREVSTLADLAAAVDDGLRALAAGEAVGVDVTRDGQPQSLRLLAR
jgi:S1-C subfamily serine protease